MTWKGGTYVSELEQTFSELQTTSQDFGRMHTPTSTVNYNDTPRGPRGVYNSYLGYAGRQGT